MKKFGFRLLAIASLSVISGCYFFEKAPFKNSELTKLSETEFGKITLEVIENFPEAAPPDLREAFGPDSDPNVYVVSDDFLIGLEEAGESWDLYVLMRNDHHIMFCDIPEQENLEIPEGVSIETQEGAGGGTFLASGKRKALRQLALDLSLSGVKACIAIPYADASEVAAGN